MEVAVAILTDRDGNGPWQDGEQLQTDTLEAINCLVGHSPRDRLSTLRFAWPVQQLRLVADHIRHDLERLERTIKPAWVFVPARGDLHQDHQTARAEALRVFKRAAILEYEILPSAPADFAPNLYVRVTQEQLERKIAAVQCYTTQRHKHYCRPEVIRAQARFRGAKVGAEFAEAFCLRWAAI